MTKTHQEMVIKWIVNQLEKTDLYIKTDEDKNENDNTGVDLIITDSNNAQYYIEAISFSVNKHGYGTGKNQSDFWKAYSQACSRLQRNGVVEYAIVALPIDYLRGWAIRTKKFNKSVWLEMAPKELYIWFVSESEIIKLSWSECYLFNP